MRTVFYHSKSLARYNLLLIGVGLSSLFWVLESAAHVIVFRDVSLVKQIYSPEPHEVWMRIIVISMFISFGIYSQWIVAARRRAEDAAKLAGAELNQIFETAADGMRVIDKEFKVKGLGKDKSPKPGMLDNITSALGNLTLEDVVSQEGFKFDPKNTVTSRFETFDGLIVTASVMEKDVFK